MSSLAKAASLRISAIVHATEDSRKVNHAIKNICHFNGSAEPAVNRAKGHHGNQITTLALTVKNSKAAEKCLGDIWDRLAVLDRDSVFSSLASRVDTSGTLFLRIDKQEAFKRIIRLRDSDPIKVGISFKTFQSKRNGLVKEIQRVLTEISTQVAGSQ
jgi:RNA binding exosome subunit